MWTTVVAIAAGLTALATIVRVLKLDKMRRGVAEFLDDWRGQPERPGFVGVPSFPQRLARVEKQAHELNTDMRGHLNSELTLIRQGIEVSKTQGDATRDALANLSDRVQALDTRVSDHRRRNEQTIELLQRAVDDLRSDASRRRYTDTEEPPS